jgi:mono/diheme cytochrome c family protein
MPRRTLAALVLFAWSLGVSRTRADEPFDAVRPLLTGKCLACHSSDARKGGLDLTRRATLLAGGDSGPAVEAGDFAASLILEKLDAGEMPPRNPLAPEQLAAFRRWVEAGAVYTVEPLAPGRAGPDWWSLQPIARPSPPALRSDWVRTPIDAFVLDRLNAESLTPNPEADRRALIRRVTFDLTGLPPTPEEVAAFIDDPRPDAYERLVDRLLASPAYGERAARLWLDVARFAESHGYETNQLRPNAWPYRDYAIRAFNDDTPFPRFVLEQFAADTLPDADWLTQAATGFLVGGTHDVVANLTDEGSRQQRADDLDDAINATGAAFLGLTVSCARCHDHKFDPITQADYYGLKALLSGMRHEDRMIPAPDAERRRGERAAVEAELARVDAALDASEPFAQPDLGRPGRAAPNSRRNVERFAPVVAASLRFTVQSTNNGIEPCLDELEIWTAESEPRNVALKTAGARASASSTYPNSEIHRLEHLNDGRYGNSRSWISAVAGKGWVRVDLLAPALIDRVVWGRDREQKFTDRTPTEYYIEAADEQGRWTVVASSADREPWRPDAPAFEPEPTPERRALLARQADLRARLAALSETIAVYAGRFADSEEIRILPRGAVMADGPLAVPSAVRSVAPRLELDPSTPEPERRLALARWIAEPANPLPARVAVNRIWQQHFGRGLVPTPADFGFNGEPPSHPALLDWLAARFLDAGGQWKPIHRLIVLSSTYRQASTSSPDALARDSQDRWLWRFPPRRLEAEQIRDATLAAAGTLDRRMGGPGYWIWEPNTNYVVVFNPLETLGPEHWRRMIYQYKPRSQGDITFAAFDCPDAGLPAARRNSSTTALQALNLLNSRFLLDQSSRLAARVRGEVGDDLPAQVDRAFRLLLGRPPTSDERDAASQLVRDHGFATLARALYNANEFLYVD